MSVGTGRPVDKDGLAVGRWTAELLTASISDIGPKALPLKSHVSNWSNCATVLFDIGFSMKSINGETPRGETPR